MTKFVSYYNLCPIDNPKEFFGVAPDSSEGNVILTLNKNIIIIIKISTQKQIKSWSVTEKLTSKVVFDKQSQRYVGVFANRALRCWDEACEDVNKCKKLKFKKPIADLVQADDNIFVLYAEGSCELLANAIEARKEQKDETQNLLTSLNAGIFNARYFKLTNGLEYLTYFERQQETTPIQLVTLAIQNGQCINTKKYKLTRPGQSEHELKPMGFAVIESNDALVLMSIWNDNGVFMLKLDDNVAPEEARAKYAARFSALKTENDMSVVGVSQNTVAIYGANCGQEGASLLLYNTKFHVVKTKQYFKVYLNASRVWSVGQYILLAMGQNLSVVSYSQTPDSLADLLGTQANNVYERRINNEQLYEEEELQDHLQFVEVNAHNMDTNQKTEGHFSTGTLCSEFADGLKIPFEAVGDFDKTLSELSHLEMSTKVVEVEHDLEEPHISLMSNYCDNGFITPEIELIAQELEACGASEYEITEKLLTLLTKANLLSDIVVCLQRYSSVSEKMLVKVLNYVLKLNQQHAKQQKMAALICHLLNSIFACDFNTQTIALHLRQEIDYESVVLLMNYLYDLLEDSAEAISIPKRPTVQGNINDGVHAEMQIIKWFSTLLSSHFQKLALSKDTDLKDLLLKWTSLCESYKTQMEDLQEAAELFYNIVDKKELTKEISSKWYTIEEVCLW